MALGLLLQSSMVRVPRVCRLSSRVLLVSALLSIFHLSGIGPLNAQTHDWSIDYGHEQAATSTNGVDAPWIVDRFQTLWSRTEQGGWLLAVERQERYGFTDVALSSQGYWRARNWTFSVDAGVTPQANFLYRAKGGGEISYRAVGTFVASGGYDFMSFPSADLHQYKPALTWYHARGEVEGRVYITHNVTRQWTSTATMVRGLYDFTPRFRLGGGASVGDRIFDIAALAAGPVQARVGFVDTRIGLTRRDFITGVVTVAREDPGFEYFSFTLGYKRVF